jgi:type I restriction enzyme S subunit
MALKQGDVLVSRANTRELVGSCAVVKSDFPALMLCDKLYRLRPNARVSSDYLARIIQVFGRSDVETEASGTSPSMVNISMDTVRNLRVCIPPIEEQDEIAEGIDRETARIDALIAKKTRFIELLKEKRQALITHAVTKGLDPSAPMKDSGVEWIGEVPEHWSIRALRFVAAVQTGIAKGKDHAQRDTVRVPYLRVANVQDGYLELDDVAQIEIPSDEVERYQLQIGDVLMNEGGDFDKLGRGHVWQGEIDLCIHQNHVFAVRPSRVMSEWLNTWTGSAPAQFFFMTRSKQSTNLASISSSNLMDLPVPCPPDNEQKSVVDQLTASLSTLDQLWQRTERSIALLKERRAALITAAVTGQIDLREVA